jgi:hypothetical protein
LKPLCCNSFIASSKANASASCEEHLPLIQELPPKQIDQDIRLLKLVLSIKI